MCMTTNPFGRVITAMATPMRPDGSVDEAGVRAVVEHLIASGHDGIAVNGTTGEAATLSDDESIAVIRIAVEAAAGRVAITAGVGSSSTAHSINLASRAAEVGAQALLLVMPYYSKPTQAGVAAHCRAVADSTDLPVMLYDIPQRAGQGFAIETLVALADHPRIVAVKDAKGDLWAASHVMASTDLLWFSGDDALTLAHLAQGAVGTVSVVGHVAGQDYAAMIAAVEAGDLAAAREIHQRLIPVTDALMTTSQGAIMVKAALVQLGVIESAFVRLPFVESPPEHLEILRAGLSASAIK
jgi:4-hydroxy-tetrahydrodipicolinate synthase